MPRRPVEFWWIAAFCALKALEAFSLSSTQSTFEHAALLTFGATHLLAGLLLIGIPKAGRWACFVLLGVEAGNQSVILLNAAEPASAKALNLVALSFCLWMIFYLESHSTRRMCARPPDAQRRPGYGLGSNLIDQFELGLSCAVGVTALMLGLPAWLAGGSGMLAYVLFGLFLEDSIRRRWGAFFVRCEPGFPINDAAAWRAACQALARKELEAARGYFGHASKAARLHPSGDLFLRMLEWHELLAINPMDGQACLQRAAYDHDWRPNESCRAAMNDYIESANADAIQALIDNRAKLIEGMVRAGMCTDSFFHSQVDRCLARVTGESFAFNALESWAAWWEDSREDWSGDSGGVSLVCRLMRWDAVVAAHSLANRIAARAEEPLLKELAAQVSFLHAMHKAIREREGVDRFIKQPQRMLLVPELSDAVGLLHADLPLLENLGMSVPVITRRLNLRVPLVDYINKLWRRYPTDLGADLPWILQTLTGKNLGVLRARAKFQAWWPQARESFLRHDRAVSAGMAALASGDETGAEKSFRTALTEQPRGLSSRYNLAVCVMRRKGHGEAKRLLLELTQLEPKEPYWWMVLGNIHRTVNKSADAHAAFRRALELGYAAPKVALERGLTFARDQHDMDAIKQFDRVLGGNPTAAKIETLVSALETEGLWKLAGHYRDEAFRRSLMPGGEPAGDVEGDGDVAA